MKVHGTFNRWRLLLLMLLFPLGVAAGEPDRVDLKKTMDLAGQNLLDMLNPSRNYLPNFLVSVDRSYQAEMHFFFPEHNIGRWWDAMLRLEDATGFVIPAHIEGAMLENLYHFFDNPDHLCLLPLDLPHKNGGLFCFHSLREAMSALDVLVRFRNSRWAAEQGHRMLKTLKSLLLPESQWRSGGTVWDVAKTKRYQELGLSEVESGWSLNLQGSEGRLIEPLLLFYQATRDPLALELAETFAKFHLSLSLRSDGEFYATPVMAGHNHSYQGTLRGLLLYGEFSGQRQYIEQVEATYRVALAKIVKRSGYTSHDLGKEGGGEISSVADAAVIALWLGVRHGYTHRLDDVDRLVRSRIVPSQILESPPLLCRIKEQEKTSSHVAQDGRVVVASCPDTMGQSIIGALGGVFSEPHAGKWSVTDVTGAGLHGLVEVYNHIVVRGRDGLTVYFHYDYEDEDIIISSMRAKQATVKIKAKKKDNLRIRIPGWVAQESLELKIAGQLASVQLSESFLTIPESQLTGEVVLTYDLPIHKEIETTAGVDYELTWRGDEIIAICPNSDFYPFYPTAENCP